MSCTGTRCADLGLVAWIALSSAEANAWNASTADPPSESGTVLDLCHIPPVEKGAGYVKERLVIFDLGGEEITHAPEKVRDAEGQMLPQTYEVFKQVEIHNHVRNVFFGTFPMERHYVVSAQVPAPPGLEHSPAVSNPDMIEAAGLDPFAAYSIACADWVAIPRIVAKQATWMPVKKRQKRGDRTIEFMAWTLDVNLELEITVFEFENGQWISRGSIRPDKRAVDVALGTIHAGEAANNLVRGMRRTDEAATYPILSASPDPACKVPLSDELRGVVEGFGQCGAATRTMVSTVGHTLTIHPLPEVASDSTEPENQADDKPPTPSTLDDLQRKILAAAQLDPERVAPSLAGQLIDENAPEGLLATVHAAQSMVQTCEQGVKGVAKLGRTLREIASNPAASAQGALLGFAACVGFPVGYSLSDATPPGTDQERSSHCTHVVDDVRMGQAALESVAVCSTRITTERTTIVAKRDAINKWWQIDAALLDCEPTRTRRKRYCMALGRAEGIHRGDLFLAMDGDRRVGYGRIIRTGSGGGAVGQHDPSKFRFRAGKPTPTTLMVERAKVGLELGLRPTFAYIAAGRRELNTQMMFGGALEAGYNAGRVIPLGDEFWMRVNLAVLKGGGKDLFFNVEALPETLHYLFSNVAVFLHVGVSFNLLYTKIADENLLGYTGSALLGLGLDFALGPDWNLRVGESVSQGFIRARLQNEDETLSIRGGFLTTLTSFLSLNRTF